MTSPHGKARVGATLGLFFACMAGLVAPTPAGAAVGCSFASATLSVTMSEAGDNATLRVADFTSEDVVLGEIVVGNGLGNVDCSGSDPLRTNTDTINVTDSSGDTTTVDIYAPTSFGPGSTAESSGPSEIEINVDLGGNDEDEVALESPFLLDRDTFIVDSAGVDTNYGDEPANATDNDIFLTGVYRLYADLGGGNDLLSGQGRGSAVGSTPTGIRLDVDGGARSNNRVEEYDDTLIGGNNDDMLVGRVGSDTIDGGLGDDVLHWGPEFLQGDKDTLAYGTAPSGVTVDLAAGLQDTGGAGEDVVIPQFVNLTAGFDNLRGSPFDDVLTGDNGPNRIIGGAGVDTMFGLSGIDKLNAKDQTKDTRIDCGPGKNRKESARVDAKDPKPISC